MVQEIKFINKSDKAKVQGLGYIIAGNIFL